MQPGARFAEPFYPSPAGRSACPLPLTGFDTHDVQAGLRQSGGEALRELNSLLAHPVYPLTSDVESWHLNAWLVAGSAKFSGEVRIPLNGELARKGIAAAATARRRCRTSNVAR
jgi:hypothetical protein